MYKSPGVGACLVCSVRLVVEQSQGGWVGGNGVREKSRRDGSQWPDGGVGDAGTQGARPTAGGSRTRSLGALRASGPGRAQSADVAG